MHYYMANLLWVLHKPRLAYIRGIRGMYTNGIA